MTDSLGPAEHAAAVEAARDRLRAFAASCPDDVWQSAPLSGQGDDRAVGVIVDHVADSYEYIGAFISAILEGQDPGVGPELVDQFNAAHATRAANVTKADATEHLQRSGDAVVALIGGLAASDLELADGRIGRLALILARHADGHRAEIEAAVAG
jgi:hypothetical protein